MYSPLHQEVISEAETGWPHRQALLRAQIASANADVVCLQECSAATFETDFEFMAELGFARSELFKKGRFRPATFWRPERLVLRGEASHRDRCLITTFTRPSGGAPLSIVNCHLSAGPEAPRRLRQMADALDFLRKDAAKVYHGYVGSFILYF